MGFMCFKCGSWMSNGYQCYYCGDYTDEEIREHYSEYIDSIYEYKAKMEKGDE